MDFPYDQVSVAYLHIIRKPDLACLEKYASKKLRMKNLTDLFDYSRSGLFCQDLILAAKVAFGSVQR